jgi:hypothetical protein
MKCPSCGGKNSRGTGACGRCGALLIKPGAVVSAAPAPPNDFVALPGLYPSDSIVVESLLRGAGIPFAVSIEGALSVRREDLADVRELLADLDVRLSDRVRRKIDW